MKGFLKFFLISSLVITISCKKKENQEFTDEDAINSIIQSSFFFQNASATGEPDTTTLQTLKLNPVFWYRAPENSPPADVYIEINGDSAFVTVEKSVEGTLNFWVLPGWKKYTKKFGDRGKIYGIFRRIGDKDSEDRGWRLVKVSGILSHSYNYDTSMIKIDSVCVFVNSQKVRTVKNPLNFYDITAFDTLTTSDKVYLEVHTPSDSVDPYFHLIAKYYHYRCPMSKDTLRDTYIPVEIPTPSVSGYTYLVVDILTHETLHDSASSYNSLLWFVPVYVK